MADSRIAVYGAIAANVAIAATKFVVAGITGSSAMLSEGIHSAVDTGNGVLLLIGRRLSERKATPEHPFGHGKELFFWSLIVAVLVFGLGGGLSMLEGIQHIMNPAPMRDPKWNYFVLFAAAIFEGTSFTVALRVFLREKGDRPFWAALHASKDPMTYTVLGEDFAALAGLAVAALGIFISHYYNLPQARRRGLDRHRRDPRRRRRAADPRGARPLDRRRHSPGYRCGDPRTAGPSSAGAQRRPAAVDVHRT